MPSHRLKSTRFNGHPPLGVNATRTHHTERATTLWFQWAPTLGGECYQKTLPIPKATVSKFQWAPTLGGECYSRRRNTTSSSGACFNGHPPLGVNATVSTDSFAGDQSARFNGHPPLGVNATDVCLEKLLELIEFQWAPTLGGECYGVDA